MQKESLFIVIEGLDGSGKTTASRLLMQKLEASFPNKIKNSFEPHDASTSGLFIRQILTKKITQFDPRVLALAFAANRLDHNMRVINPWLSPKEAVNQPNILICDRYYLSSLVYQTSPDFGLESVMALNEKARRPDIIFFFNVSNEVCYERMANRNLPQELFETKLSETREKYLTAIDFLQKRGDNIVEIDASVQVEAVVQQMLDAIHAYEPNWKVNEIEVLSSKKNIAETNTEAFLKSLEKEGYEVGKELPGMPFDSFELSYKLPLGVIQRGCAIILEESPRYDLVVRLLQESNFYPISDFMIVGAKNANALSNEYFEREKVIFENGGVKLSPSLVFVEF
jgi:dTMP kinase